MESLKEDLNLVINSPAVLKHFSASTEDGGRVLRQIFSFLSTLRQRSDVVSTWNGTWMRNAYSPSAVVLLFAQAYITRRALTS